MTSIYGNILVHLDGGEKCLDRVKMAADLAKATDARLTGLFAETDPNVPGYIPTWPTQHFIDRRDAAAACFEEQTKAAGVAGEFHYIASGGISRINAEFARAARACDLAVVSQRDPDADRHLPDFFVGHAVADSGGAVLVLPYAGKFTLGQGRAIIAWDGEKATGRAVRAAMPLIRAATGIVVLTIPLSGDAPEPDPPAYADPVHWLKGLNKPVEREHLIAQSSHVADLILSRVADDFGGVLVVGINYPDGLKSPFRKTKARRLLDQITVPTLFAS